MVCELFFALCLARSVIDSTSLVFRFSPKMRFKKISIDALFSENYSRSNWRKDDYDDTNGSGSLHSDIKKLRNFAKACYCFIICWRPQNAAAACTHAVIFSCNFSISGDSLAYCPHIHGIWKLPLRSIRLKHPSEFGSLFLMDKTSFQSKICNAVKTNCTFRCVLRSLFQNAVFDFREFVSHSKGKASNHRKLYLIETKRVFNLPQSRQ